MNNIFNKINYFYKEYLSRGDKNKNTFEYPTYGSIELMSKWYDTQTYFDSKQWMENRELTNLRPSFKTLIDKKDIVGLEIGVGKGLNSLNIFKNLDIAKLYLVDIADPSGEPGVSLVQDPKVKFVKTDSLEFLQTFDEKLDFVYLDGSHEFHHVLNELPLAYRKLKIGGILSGHDYEQFGVMAAVQTFYFNLWHYKKLKPDEVKFAPCLDDHPGYPKEYLECGFPVDWWLEKSYEIDKDFEMKLLRNG